MHTEVFEETASFIIGINVLITVGCQRRSQIYLKRPYTCTGCKDLSAARMSRQSLISGDFTHMRVLQIDWHVLFSVTGGATGTVWCWGLEMRRDVLMDGGGKSGGRGTARIEPILDSVPSSLSRLFCTEVLCCMSSETRRAEELIVMELLHEWNLLGGTASS
jgi:hypothetical protein